MMQVTLESHALKTTKKPKSARKLLKSKKPKPLTSDSHYTQNYFKMDCRPKQESQNNKASRI